MSTSTKVIFFIGILLLIYGYLCRLLSIYFFWDSKHFGWIIILTGLMGFLIDLKKARTARRKNLLWVRIAIGIILFVFAAGLSAIIIFKSSPAYKIAVELIKTDGGITNEIGDIRGFGLIPSGSGLPTIISGATSGTADFVITVRGNKGHRDVEIQLAGSSPIDWSVLSVKMTYV